MNLRRARLALPAGLFLAAAVSTLTMAWNVSSGPLANLNDIGGWRNRLIFLSESAAAEFALLTLAALLNRKSAGRMLLRQGLTALAFVTGLLAINQKTFWYAAQIQPVIRAMDGGGPGAMAGQGTGLSSAALTLLYLLTRGPVYDMYPVKLFSIFCWQALCLLLTREAEDRGMDGPRATAALALMLILPQGFLSAACAGQAEIAAALLLLLAFRSGRGAAFAALSGAACALSGACLPLLPWLIWTKRKELRLSRRGCIAAATAALGAALALQLPAALCGVPIWEALASPLTQLLGAPVYASGSPNLMAFFPRSAAEEMPEVFLLRRVPGADFATNASPFYTKAHFELLMRGLALTGLAAFAGVSAFAAARIRDGLRLALTVAAAALFTVPGASMALWLAADALCVLAVLNRPGLRPPCLMLLFATAAGCCYPVTEEILVRPAAAAFLVLLALCLLTGAIAFPADFSRDREGA